MSPKLPTLRWSTGDVQHVFEDVQRREGAWSWRRLVLRSSMPGKQDVMQYQWYYAAYLHLDFCDRVKSRADLHAQLLMEAA